MLEADLYLNKIDICRYLPANAQLNCQDFMSQITAVNENLGILPFFTSEQIQSFKTVLEAKTYLPSVPLLTMPQPVEKGLIPVNDPNENSLVLVTGNNRFTFEVLVTVWAQGLTPAYFLIVECMGNTVDMAMVYGDFTPGRLAQAIAESNINNIVKHRHLIVPGFTASLEKDFANATGWEIEVGPVCAAELPLFLGERWVTLSKPE